MVNVLSSLDATELASAALTVLLMLSIAGWRMWIWRRGKQP